MKRKRQNLSPARLAPPSEFSGQYTLNQYRLQVIAETAVKSRSCDKPELAAEFWQVAVATSPGYDPDKEQCVVLMINTRRNIIGWDLVSIGSLDETKIHAREVYRKAIVAAASAIIIMHNHPTGDATPSEADIRATRDLIKAGNILRIELLDHVIVAEPNRVPAGRTQGYCSLRELGYFYAE